MSSQIFFADADQNMIRANLDALPQLIGSEKQIAWATDIRAKRAIDLAAQANMIFANITAAGKMERTAENMDKAAAAWSVKHSRELAETSAKVWIDPAAKVRA